MSKQKGLAPILIVLLVAVLGIGGYFIYSNESIHQSQTIQPSPSPTDETTNWKTYQNVKNKYEVKMPPNFEAKELIGQQGVSSISFESSINPLFKFDIEVIPGPPKGFIEKIFALKVNETSPEALNYKRLEDEIINNERFILVYSSNIYEGNERLILFVKKGNVVYSIGDTYKDDKELKNFRLFYSTFKFTQ